MEQVGEKENLNKAINWLLCKEITMQEPGAQTVDIKYSLSLKSRSVRWLQSVAQVKSLLTACTYLEDERLEVMGLKVYGSPWQPRFSDSAFNLSRGAELRAVWDKIPSDTDILVTHSPPLGVMDQCRSHTRDGGTRPAGRSGCEDLTHQLVTRLRPRLHVFGHVHEGKFLNFINSIE